MTAALTLAEVAARLGAKSERALKRLIPGNPAAVALTGCSRFRAILTEPQKGGPAHPWQDGTRPNPNHEE